MLFMVIAKRSHFGVDGASLKLFPPCCHSCVSEVSSDVSYGGSVKQQTPCGDYSPSERFAQCCAQQHRGWKPHGPLLGMGERILAFLKASKKSLLPTPDLVGF